MKMLQDKKVAQNFNFSALQGLFDPSTVENADDHDRVPQEEQADTRLLEHKPVEAKPHSSLASSPSSSSSSSSSSNKEVRGSLKRKNDTPSNNKFTTSSSPKKPFTPSFSFHKDASPASAVVSATDNDKGDKLALDHKSDALDEDALTSLVDSNLMAAIGASKQSMRDKLESRLEDENAADEDDFDLDDDEPEEEDGILAELRKARQGYGDDEEDY